MSDMYFDVARFNEKVIGIPWPDGEVKALMPKRLEWFLKVANEELGEFVEAYSEDDVPGQVDAIIDLVYFALGRLVEMGIKPAGFTNCWAKVQAANMLKKKGNKGRGSDMDAVKPDGWKSPDLKEEINGNQAT